MSPSDPVALGLPHREPFIFVDEVLALIPGESAEARKVFPLEEPFFRGHFPGDPLVPGVILTEALALQYHAQLLHQVVLMLCAGVIHGDLSEYNILVDRDGPVIIDLPQAIDAAGNTAAGAMLERDVANLTTFFGRFAPQLAATRYGSDWTRSPVKEWMHEEVDTITPETGISDAFRTISERGYRHLPVVSDGALVGIVTMRWL